VVFLGLMFWRSSRKRERLLERVIVASDVERRRIAGTVHDGAVQDLMGVSMSLQAAGRGRSQEARAELDEIADRTRVITRTLRSLLNSIYPLAVPEEGWAFGLDDSVEALRETGVLVTVDIAEVKLTRVEELLLLRVAREALRNVHAHAAAREVAVTFDVHRHRPRLTIADDGVGFGQDVAQAQRNDGHLGLALMRDLADELDAHLDIVSASGRGTTVILTLRETT
jgi:signal transduction histidine kinase